MAEDESAPGRAALVQAGGPGVLPVALLARLALVAIVLSAQ